MEMEMDMVFVTREDMTSVYELSEISDLAETAYLHFMNYENEVLYLLMHGVMYGVLSIGDLERFYNTDRTRELKPNREFTFISTVDYGAAAEFFARVRTICEIPVVYEGGVLLGVIQKKKPAWLRLDQRKTLKSARYGENEWHKNEILRFIKHTKSKVLIYTIDLDNIYVRLSPKERSILERRQHLWHTTEDNVDNLYRGMTDKEWELFWEDECGEDIADKLREESQRCIDNMVIQNGIAFFSDMEGDIRSFKSGFRVTPNHPDGADRKIAMFGPCIVLGGYCKDNQTIEAYLQEILNKKGYTSWKVLNRGMYGERYCYHQMFAEALSENDISIVWVYKQWLPEQIVSNDIIEGDLTGVFQTVPDLINNIVDSVYHCNHVVNQMLAERIFKDLSVTQTLDSPRRLCVPQKIQDYYVGWDVHEYFIDYCLQYGLSREDDKIVGAIVMNCNPFTKGHRYLIEQALETAEKLYIFVVEEDKSYFSFKDRFRMVCSGVEDLDNVVVVPSGKFILSKDTFAQYFEKASVQYVESMDYDLYIFGETVAKMLGIRYRFVGEEPFDKVTREYNETMKRILPEFGVEIIEIPRKTDSKERIISATMVRKAIKEKNMEIIEQLCPTTSVEYIKENYCKDF